MATKITISGSQVNCVYDDRFRPLMEALGVMKIKRATEIEYEGGEWVARLISTGQVIARGKDRSEVIQQEVQWLENNGRNNEPHSNS